MVDEIQQDLIHKLIHGPVTNKILFCHLDIKFQHVSNAAGGYEPINLWWPSDTI